MFNFKVRMDQIANAVGISLGIILSIFVFAAGAHAASVVQPTIWANGDTVTAAKLNGNWNALGAAINGGLDNTNANTVGGYHFFETAASLPAAGNQGRIIFNTSNNTLNTDNGSSWQTTVTPSGTPSTGTIPYYNSGWTLLSPGSQYYSLVSNGASSLPSYQQVSLTQGVTNTLPIANGGTGQTTANTALNAFLPTQTSNGGKYLTTDGSTTTSWGNPNGLSNGLFSFSASTDNIGFITGTTLTGTPSSNYNYWAITGGQNSNYTTVISTKYVKTSSVNTVTVWARIWQSTSNTAQCKATIGTASGTVSGTNSQTTPEWKSITVDVSGLSNGTTYDVTIAIAHSQAGGGNDYLGSAIGIGS